jgi:hypothetical protein
VNIECCAVLDNGVSCVVTALGTGNASVRALLDSSIMMRDIPATKLNIVA